MPSKIEWTEEVWNPVTGCTKVSEGCKHCYAERMARRLQMMGQKNYANGFKVTCHDHMLDRPLHWRKPRVVFVNSMSDLFHKNVPDDFIVKVFAVMYASLRHHYLILTKRPERMVALLGDREFIKEVLVQYIMLISDAAVLGDSVSIPWPLPNVGLGVSVEDDSTRHRIETLLKTDAAFRFVSYEPVLGPVDIKPYLPSEYWCWCGYKGDEPGKEYCDRCGEEFPPPTKTKEPDCPCGSNCYEYACPVCGETGPFGHWTTGPFDERPAVIDWVICGGESGPGARPMHPDWARSARDQCKATGVPFFFKQWGKVRPLPFVGWLLVAY